MSAFDPKRHVEHVTNWQPTTVDAAMSFEPATVEVIRGETDEGGGRRPKLLGRRLIRQYAAFPTAPAMRQSAIVWLEALQEKKAEDIVLVRSCIEPFLPKAICGRVQVPLKFGQRKLGHDRLLGWDYHDCLAAPYLSRLL
jgi:hypothetical protein